MRRVVAVVALALVVGACGDAVVDREAPAETSATTSPATTTPVTTTASTLVTTTVPPTIEPAPTTTQPSKTPSVGESVYPKGQIDESLGPVIAAAISDLASRLGVDAADVTVSSAVTVTWSDASIGCPQPGMQYAQVLVEGSLVELEYGGRVYRYHAGDTDQPFLCEQPLVDLPTPPPPTTIPTEQEGGTGDEDI